MNTPATPPADAASPARRSDTARRNTLILALGLACIAAFAWWIHQRWTHVYTEDARVATHMIEVSTRASGQVETFAVGQGSRLGAGALIAQIDDRAAKLALEELEATQQALDSQRERIAVQIDMVDRETGGKLRAARSQYDAAIASRGSAQSDLEFKKGEWDRAESLLKRQIISRQQWENARNAWQQSEQMFQRASAEAESARAMVAEAEASQSQIQVLTSELRALEHEGERISASVARQKVAIGELRVSATVGGVVDQTFVHAGEYVVPGQRLLLMHDPADIWIDANIKETEIRHLQPGDGVAIRVDAYPDQKFRGEVKLIGNAATSQFSLLPSSGASGNFTKVTQRLPVRISIAQSGELLRPGMMVEVAIEIR
jgi:membrane fusion protein (multidrug efflux system)